MAISILKGYRLNQIEKFVQELTWRDYYKKMLKHDINKDIKNKQKMFTLGMPKTVFDKETKIKIFDKCIGDLYDFGYLHNQCELYCKLYNKCKGITGRPYQNGCIIIY